MSTMDATSTTEVTSRAPVWLSADETKAFVAIEEAERVDVERVREMLVGDPRRSWWRRSRSQFRSVHGIGALRSVLPRVRGSQVLGGLPANRFLGRRGKLVHVAWAADEHAVVARFERRGNDELVFVRGLVRSGAFVGPVDVTFARSRFVRADRAFNAITFGVFVAVALFVVSALVFLAMRSSLELPLLELVLGVAAGILAGRERARALAEPIDARAIVDALRIWVVGDGRGLANVIQSRVPSERRPQGDSSPTSSAKDSVFGASE